MSRRSIKNQNSRGQILLLAIFGLVTAGTITYILTQPIITQMVGVRSALQSFQAIATAETALELEFLNQFKNKNLLAANVDDPDSSRQQIVGGRCQADVPIRGSVVKKDDRHSSNCVYGQTPSDAIFDIRVVTDPMIQMQMQIEVIGKSGGNARSLIFQQKK